MAKVGRNDPCPCGSGLKYKRCCFAKDEAAESERFAHTAQLNAAAAAAHKKEMRAMEASMADLQRERDLAEASNAVVDLVDSGRLDEAEIAARELLVRFPDVHDGYDRLGMVYEARGESRQAADYYRKVIEFVIARPEQYDPEFSATFRRLVAQLDPPDSPGLP